MLYSATHLWEHHSRPLSLPPPRLLSPRNPLSTLVLLGTVAIAHDCPGWRLSSFAQMIGACTRTGLCTRRHRLYRGPHRRTGRSCLFDLFAHSASSGCGRRLVAGTLKVVKDQELQASENKRRRDNKFQKNKVPESLDLPFGVIVKVRWLSILWII